MGSDSYHSEKWWKEAVVYQVYPASFLDTNDDGWGDIRGITSKVQYLKDLGVDVVWVSPIYKSPQADMGYDIADYRDIDPRYGTLADVDHLVAELKQRDMKLVMDLVVNHTSHEHQWFLDSKSSKDSSKRAWYIWKPPKYDSNGRRQPPNNWCQILGEAKSAWIWDERTEEYYLTLFTPEQPDLNWENPAVRAAVHDIMHFWLKKGASGFRMDVINLISKVQTFPDGEIAIPDQKWQPGTKYFANGPRLHEFLKEIHGEVLSKYDAMTVGEMPWVSDSNEIIKVVGSESNELNMIFIFDIVDIDCMPGSYRYSDKKWTIGEMKEIVNKYQRLMIENNGWNSVFIENHDQPRSVSRFTDDSDQWREKGAKLLALMQTTLGGTLYVYQGEELGMRNVPKSWPPEEYKDVESINFWKKINNFYPGNAEKIAWARGALQAKARDNARTPMQWKDAPHGGFTSPQVTPWMRVNDDYPAVNAERQSQPHQQIHKSGSPHSGVEDELSVWNFWSKAIGYRKDMKSMLVYGGFKLLEDGHPTVIAYARTAGERETGPALVVALNFSDRAVDWDVPDGLQLVRWEISTYEFESRRLGHQIQLQPWEGALGQVEIRGR